MFMESPAVLYVEKLQDYSIKGAALSLHGMHPKYLFWVINLVLSQYLLSKTPVSLCTVLLGLVRYLIFDSF
jgi:hypothetical protein